MSTKTKRVKKFPAYSEEDLINAVAAVKNKTMTYKKASEFYKVPTTTIADRVSGKYDTKISKPGNVFCICNR